MAVVSGCGWREYGVGRRSECCSRSAMFGAESYNLQTKFESLTVCRPAAQYRHFQIHPVVSYDTNLIQVIALLLPQLVTSNCNRWHTFAWIWLHWCRLPPSVPQPHTPLLASSRRSYSHRSALFQAISTLLSVVLHMTSHEHIITQRIFNLIMNGVFIH